MALPYSIEHLFSGATQVMQDWAPNLDPTGFDTATQRIDFRGTVSALLAAYKKGTNISGTKMYVTGVIGIEDQRFGWVTATIGAKGFWENVEPAASVASEVTTSEILYPFSDGVNSYFYPAPGKTGAAATTNPATGRYWRVRVLTEEYSLTREGVDIGAVGTAHVPPAGPSGAPQGTLYDNAPAGLQDPLLTAGIIGSAGAWKRMGYSVPSTEVIGTLCFRKWNDRWQWIPAEAP